MSLESGKKYGFTASMINIITPVISIALMLGLFIYQLSRISTVTPAPFGTGIYMGIFAVIGVVSLIGLILFFLAMNHLSHYYNEPAIFKNALYGFLITVIGGVVAIIIEFTFIAGLASRFPSANTTATITPIISQFIIGFIAIIGIAFLFGVISAVLYWRAFSKLAEKSSVENFKTAGLLYLIGILLTVVGVGVILVWIAWIYAAMGYRQLKPLPAATQVYPSMGTPNVSGRIFCSYCGTENDANAIYCKQCGKPLHTNQTSI